MYLDLGSPYKLIYTVDSYLLYILEEYPIYDLPLSITLLEVANQVIGYWSSLIIT